MNDVVIKGKHVLKGRMGNGKIKMNIILALNSLTKNLPPKNYTGPNFYGNVTQPLVKQFKTNVGGVNFLSAPFQKNGHFVYTFGSLTQARETAKCKVGEGKDTTEVVEGGDNDDDNLGEKDGNGDVEKEA